MLLSKQNMTVFLMVMSTYLVITMAKPTVDYCRTCLSVSEFIQNMEHNQTESIMKMNLYKMCLKENEGKNDKMCTFIATAIQNTLKHIGDNEFCSQINACPSKKAFKRPHTINEERCGFCSDLVDSFRTVTSLDFVSDNLSSYCELTGDFKDECLDNLNTNFMNFVDYVQNKMDSQTFCHAIKSCHYQTVEEKKAPSMGDLVALRNPIQMASHLDFLAENDPKSVDVAPFGALSCIVCRQVIVMVYASLHKNSTRESVEKVLAKSCKAIFFRNKEKEQECESKVVKNAEIVLNGFINKVPPELVCLLTGMCIPGIADFNQNEIPSSPRMEVGIVEQIRPFEDKPNKDVGIIPDNVKCYLCEKIVQFLFKELDGKKAREEIKNLLENACDRLFKKGEKQDKCEEYVDAYTDKLIDLVEKSGNPGIICNTLHLCPINSKLVAEYDAKKLDSTIDGRPVVAVQLDDEPKKPVYKVDWCRVCSVAYPWLNKAMQIDSVKDRIMQSAHDFCDSSALPIPVDSCHSKADQYLEVIRTNKDVETGCQQIKLCPAEKKTESFVHFDIVPSILEASSNEKLNNFGWWEDAKCAGCKLIIKGLYANLNKTIHSPNTRKLIEQTCDHIPQDDLREKCVKDAQIALETLYKDLTEHMAPEEACEMMKYCKKKSDHEHDSEKLKPILQSSACNTCKGIIYPYFHNAFQNPDVRTAAKRILARICDHSNKVDECKSATEQFVDNIADSETSEEGCKQLCQSEESLLVSSVSKVSECTVCQATMIGINEIFTNEHVKSKLNATLENFCKERANQNVQSKCKTLVRENLPRFYELIEKAIDHDTGFCNSMGFCPAKQDVLVEIISSSISKQENVYSALESNLKLLPNADELLDEDLLVTSDSGAVCENCKKVFRKIEQDVLSKRDFKEKLLRKLLDTCPKNDDKCRIFYDKYINFFYDSLARNVDPKRACPALKLCKVNLELPEYGDLPFEPSLNLTESTACKECHSALDYLKNTLSNKTVIEFLMKEVEQNVCQPLNFIERKACNRLVKSFGPKIIAHFASKIDKQKICTNRLRLCEEGEEVLVESEDDAFDNFEIDLINFIEDENCVLCTKTVNKINKVRGNSQRQVSVDEVCEEDDADCRRFMVDFQDFFVKGDHNVDGLVACSELDVCFAPGRIQLLGGPKCTFGPSYWCLSSTHAESCNAADYCKNNVWQTVSVEN